MKTKHYAILDFQKKLILSANQQSRIDAINLFRIVAANLKEFTTLRMPEERYESMLDGMNDVVEVYRMWATAILRRFPSLVDFHPICYGRQNYIIRTVADDDEPNRFINPSSAALATTKTFPSVVEDACIAAEVSKKALTIVHCWSNFDDVGDDDREDAFGEDVLIATPLYDNAEEHRAVYAFYWKYNFLIDFAEPEMFDDITGYLDGMTYKTYPTSYVHDYEKCTQNAMKMPKDVIGDESLNEILFRTPLKLEKDHDADDDSDKEPVIITPLDALKMRCDLDNAEEIWMTIYRTDREGGPYYEFLMDTAKRLKDKFHVYIELMARGDTRNNLAIYHKLKEFGVDVACRAFIEPLREFKVHAKIMVVKCKNDDATDAKYWHWTRLVSTGNFVTSAANQYRDTFYISHQVTRKESAFIANAFPTTANLFNDLMRCVYVKGYAESSAFCKSENDVLYGSDKIRDTIYGILDKLIDDARDMDEHARIKYPFLWIKVNNITDQEVINRILDAVRAGVEVKIIARSGCSIPTQISYPNLSIKTITGRYLEHDRFLIWGWYNQDPQVECRVVPFVQDAYIMSADLMPRNLYSRVEFMCKMDGYEKDAVSRLFAGLYDAMSYEESGFFSFNITQPYVNQRECCRVDFMPLEYDPEYDAVADISDGGIVVDASLNGDSRFNAAVRKIFEDFGRTPVDAIEFIRSLDQSPQKNHHGAAKPVDIGAYEEPGMITNLLTSFMDQRFGNLNFTEEPETMDTAMDDEGMENAVRRSRPARIYNYLTQIGHTDGEKINLIIKSILSSPDVVQEFYIDQLRIAANMSRPETREEFTEKFMHGVVMDRVVTPEESDEIPEGLQKFFDQIHLSQELQYQLINTVLNTKERRDGFAEAMKWIDENVSMIDHLKAKGYISDGPVIVDKKIPYAKATPDNPIFFDLVTMKELDPEVHSLVIRFIGAFSGSAEELKFLQDKYDMGPTEFRNMLVFYKDAVMCKKTIDLDEIDTWIKQYIYYVRHGGDSDTTIQSGIIHRVDPSQK